jgi:hypothetical protein
MARRQRDCQDACARAGNAFGEVGRLQGVVVMIAEMASVPVLAALGARRCHCLGQPVAMTDTNFRHLQWVRSIFSKL